MSLYDRLAAALARPAPDLTRAADLDPHEWPEARPAAVLVPVVERAHDPGILLTRRNAAMRTHAGQVSFPGGRIDPGEDAVAAALREAEEEIALPRADVRLVGAFDAYVTGTGYVVTPVLGLVPPDLPLVPNPAEVEQLFEVPMRVLLDPARQREEESAWRGRQRRYWRIHYRDYDIWGATAAMIVNLTRRLTP
ncbi:CoA pyrophosphatase [Sphingomicrobium astaxanthinifaciens]|uniref:CoA pyrophosphatase n=1 Tax=Sphingomicrobium astaxanthinifaciens TaxID=1227949 RepID=UPI001FCBDC0B|nr:CoA pyrophosphatase [Sphingomicrobium astaxanthinifaciens]MCJ7420566.1 CoA pyrophosphatase [Sphingomicrobium astaxanthinifaciens]